MAEATSTKELVLKHFYNYPNLQIQDIFKFLYQSSFGCEHALPPRDRITAYIEEEHQLKAKNSKSVIEQLDGKYFRVPLSFIDNGLSAETLGKLFLLSAKQEQSGSMLLRNKLEAVKEIIKENLLPFDFNEFEDKMENWERQGFPAVHHSDIFRQCYNPSYRVISCEFIPFLPFFSEIDKRIKKGPLKIAIEGGSASGKSTLAEIMKKIYDCTVFHTDDFFLPKEKKTPERLSQAGGNLDRERFIEEVLVPLKENKTVNYRRFDCSTMSIQEAVRIIPENLIVTEGAYSMHPDMEKFYDFSVFLDISPQFQRERILKRNSPDFAERFFNQWIPLENKYFEETDTKNRCSLCINIAE